MHYWSRSRKKLWLKGETSGHTQRVVRSFVDCDADTLLFEVEQQGGAACHTGYESCFFQQINRRRIARGNHRSKVFDPEKVYPQMNHRFHSSPGREEFRELAKQGNLIPVYTELIADCETPGVGVSKDRRRRLFVPAGIGGKERPGGPLFVRREQSARIFRATAETSAITENGEVREYKAAGDPLERIAETHGAIPRVAMPDLPRFIGGASAISPTMWCDFSSRPSRRRRRTNCSCRRWSS